MSAAITPCHRFKTISSFKLADPLPAVGTWCLGLLGKQESKHPPWQAMPDCGCLEQTHRCSLQSGQLRERLRAPEKERQASIFMPSHSRERCRFLPWRTHARAEFLPLWILTSCAPRPPIRIPCRLRIGNSNFIKIALFIINTTARACFANCWVTPSRHNLRSNGTSGSPYRVQMVPSSCGHLPSSRLESRAVPAFTTHRFRDFCQWNRHLVSTESSGGGIPRRASMFLLPCEKSACFPRT